MTKKSTYSFLKKIFENEFKVVTASSGDEGLKRMNENQIDAVISDMRMPEMNGLEFIAQARIVFQDSSYFILTGYEFNTDLEKALETHLIDKIFKKPFDYELIKHAVLESKSPKDRVGN